MKNTICFVQYDYDHSAYMRCCSDVQRVEGLGTGMEEHVADLEKMSTWSREKEKKSREGKK